jgi:hypothetical protein
LKFTSNEELKKEFKRICRNRNRYFREFIKYDKVNPAKAQRLYKKYQDWVTKYLKLIEESGVDAEDLL